MLVNILIAFAIVTLIGLVAGTLLAVASHYFSVKEDETVQLVRECLPGVNCGACGYTGCDEYAKAVAAGEAKVTLCVPGAADTANAVAGVLGVEAESTAAQVAFVRCNGNCEATSHRAHYEGIDTCAAATMLYGGPCACRFGCVGCGDCAAVCPTGAICTNDGLAHISKEICIGCGLCVQTCPKQIIEMRPKDSTVVVLCSNTDKGALARKACKNACIGCKKCELGCEQQAITVQNNLARIDYGKCNGCGKCVANCPMHCIATI